MHDACIASRIPHQSLRGMQTRKRFNAATFRKRSLSLFSLSLSLSLSLTLSKSFFFTIKFLVFWREF